MQSPYSQSPIPSPYGSPSSLPPVNRGDWSTAPKIVKNWAYQLTWLGIVIWTLMFLAMLMPGNAISFAAGSAGLGRGLVMLAALVGMNIWLNRAFKSGQPAAWVGQIVLSCFCLLSFPVGTLIHAYILSQWFKPEVKAWFGRS